MRKERKGENVVSAQIFDSPYFHTLLILLWEEAWDKMLIKADHTNRWWELEDISMSSLL